MWFSLSCCRCVELLVGGEWVGHCRWAMKVRDVDAGLCLAAWLARRQSCFFTTTTAAAITTITTNVFWAITKLSPHRLLPDWHWIFDGWTWNSLGRCTELNGIGWPLLSDILARTTAGSWVRAGWRTHQDCVLHLDCHPIFYCSAWRWLMDDDAWIPRFLLSRIRLGPGVLDELGKGGREVGQRPLEFGIGFGGSCFGSTREGNRGEWREGKATTFRGVWYWLWTGFLVSLLLSRLKMLGCSKHRYLPLMEWWRKG